jgi:glycosyltransferase 2 family protein
MKKFVSAALKLAFIGICFWIIFRKVPLHDVYSRLAGTSPLFVLLAFATVLTEPVVVALKWKLLLQKKGIVLSLAALTRIVFASNFCSVAIPSSLGADALRLLMLRGQKHSLAHSAGSLITDRVLGVLAIVTLSLAAGALVWGQIPVHGTLLSAAGIAGVLLVLIGLLASQLPARLGPWFRGLLLPAIGRCFGHPAGIETLPALRFLSRLTAKAEEAHDSFRSFREEPRTLGIVYLLNLVIQALRILQIHCLFHAVHHPVPLFQEAAFMPIIVLLTMLPISYFGLGIKEGAFLYFFGQAGVPSPVCLSASCITYVLILGAMMPGAIFTLLGLKPNPPPPAESSSPDIF